MPAAPTSTRNNDPPTPLRRGLGSGFFCLQTLHTAKLTDQRRGTAALTDSGLRSLHVKTNALVMLAIAAAAFCGASKSSAQPGAATAPTATFEAGKHYQRLSPAQPTSSETGKVEVAEIFMFGCPGCFGFEPHVQKWLGTKPDYVSFVRIPAPWNAVAVLHARAYYTAEALGKAEEIDGPFFNEFHVNGNYLDSESKIAAFFGQHGVDAKTFSNTFNSFAVDAKLKRAEDLIRRYRVPSTPGVVVNGKYVTSGQMAGSYETWFAIINELAAIEHAAAGAGNP
jgi:thiol:disulfide interchange protein DsbA